MTKGKYIVIEGAEGVGKTTMVQLLAAQLQAAQLPVKIMREPDSQNDLTARAIRRLTQDPRFPMSTRTEVLLYNAARSQSLEVIRQMIDNGVTCLVDRSYLTTLAIQYYGRGDVQDYARINEIINFAVGDIQPDLMVVLDAPVTVLRERVKHRYSGERFDNLDESFLERVRAGYLWEAKQRNLPVVYATDDVDTVFAEVWKHVAATLAVRDKAGGKSEPQSVAEVLAANPPAAARAASVEPPVLAAVAATVEQPIPDNPVPPEATRPLDKLAALDTQEALSYFVPHRLPKKLASVYRQALDSILKNRAQLLDRLKDMDDTQAEVARLTLPAACYLDGDRQAVQGITGHAKGALAAFANDELRQTYNTGDSQQVRLTSYWPRNELDTVVDIIYPYSNLAQGQLAEQVSAWPYSKKTALLRKHLTDKTDILLSGTHYSCELIADYRQLLALRQTGAKVRHQPLTPRYGYDVPAAVEQAELAGSFEACFDTSLELYGQLQAAGYEAEAQLATLIGHKARAQVTLSAARLAALQTASDPLLGLEPLVSQLVAAVAEVHPLIAAASFARPSEAARR